MNPAYRLIGYPLGHTMSPFIHRRLFALHGADASYDVQEIPPEALPSSIDALRHLDGFNVTIPHKRMIIPALDHLDESAALYGAVNTVRSRAGTLTGYNTDGIGFLRALESAGIPLSGRVAVLGAGGAARVFACEAARAGASVTLAVRPPSLPAAVELAGDIARRFESAASSAVTIEALRGAFDLLINATPVGMYPHEEATPLPDLAALHPAALFDAIYNPRETLLMRKLRASGTRVLGGMPMLVWQAAAAQEIWFDAYFDPEDIEALIDVVCAEMAARFGRRSG